MGATSMQIHFLCISKKNRKERRRVRNLAVVKRAHDNYMKSNKKSILGISKKNRKERRRVRNLAIVKRAHDNYMKSNKKNIKK